MKKYVTKKLTKEELKTKDKGGKGWGGWYCEVFKHWHYYFWVKEKGKDVLYDCGCTLPYKDKAYKYR